MFKRIDKKGLDGTLEQMEPKMTLGKSEGSKPLSASIKLSTESTSSDTFHSKCSGGEYDPVVILKKVVLDSQALLEERLRHQQRSLNEIKKLLTNNNHEAKSTRNYSGMSSRLRTVGISKLVEVDDVSRCPEPPDMGDMATSAVLKSAGEETKLATGGTSTAKNWTARSRFTNRFVQPDVTESSTPNSSENGTSSAHHNDNVLSDFTKGSTRSFPLSTKSTAERRKSLIKKVGGSSIFHRPERESTCQCCHWRQWKNPKSQRSNQTDGAQSNV